MRITRVALQKTFYGLVLGAFCFGWLTRLGSRPKFVAARLLRNPYRMFGVMAGTTFYGISNFPKFTVSQVREALVSLVELGEVEPQVVLKYDIGIEPEKHILNLVDRYVAGKIHRKPSNTLYVPYIGSGLLPTPTHSDSEHTQKSVANLFQLRNENSYNALKKSKQFAAIQYQQGLIESLETELAYRRETLSKLLENSKAEQLALPLDDRTSPFISEGTIPEVSAAMPEVVAEE